MGGNDEDAGFARLLVLWNRLQERLTNDAELVELFQLLRQHLLRTSAVKSLHPQEREDVLMSYLHEKLLDRECPVRAPQNHHEFARYIGNFIVDHRRKHAAQMPETMDAFIVNELLDGEQGRAWQGAFCGPCASDDFSSQAASSHQAPVIQTWLETLENGEQALLWAVLCLGESAMDSLARHDMLGATHKVRKLGLRLSNPHRDAAWSTTGWFKNTKLGFLFRRLDINADNDMLADARQALQLICQLLGSRSSKGGGAV
jgi:hypothetical protein